jgi:ankyrin repeat protein
MLCAAGAKVGPTSLHEGARYGCVLAFEALVEAAVAQQFNIDTVDPENRTALFSAAMATADNPEIARCLARAGANLNHSDDYGWIALHGAAYKDNWETFHAMAELGANVQATEEEGLDPFEYANSQHGLSDAEISGHKARILSHHERNTLLAQKAPGATEGAPALGKAKTGARNTL